RDRRARTHSGERDRSDRRAGPSAIARGAPTGPLPARRPRVGAGQAEVAAGLVDEDEPRRVDPLGLLTPGRPGRLVPLAGAQRLFFRAQPRYWRITRLIVVSATRTPLAASYQAQCSSRVASGMASRRGGSAAASADILIGNGPRLRRGASAPVCRRSARYRLTVARPTPKVRAASLLVIPPSTAATIRSRRSSE